MSIQFGNVTFKNFPQVDLERVVSEFLIVIPFQVIFHMGISIGFALCGRNSQTHKIIECLGTVAVQYLP